VSRLTGLAPVLVVPDVAAALAYYGSKLGFEGEAYQEEPGIYAFTRRDGCELHFARGDEARPNHEVVAPDLFDVYLWVDDVEGLHDELVFRGADVILAPTTQRYGMHEIRVRDLNGYILAFGRRA
jgi:catechol 2,3-dioxygenase-like lactoylglutathione lyase family enzyme